MAQRILSAEGLDDGAEIAQPVDQTVSLNPDYERILEGQDIESALGNIEQQITEDSPAAQLQTAATALEHFKHRLDDGSVKRASLESIETLVTPTKLREDIRKTRAAVRKGLNGAMEGFFDKMRDGLARSTTSKATMMERGLAALQEIRNSGVQAHMIDHAPWADVFTEFKGQNIASDNIRSLLESITERSDVLDSILVRAVEVLNSAIHISKQSNGTPKAENEAAIEIYALTQEVDEIERALVAAMTNSATNRRTIETLDASDAQAFEQSLRGMVDSLDKLMNTFYVRFSKLESLGRYDPNDDVEFTVNAENELEYESTPKAGRMALDYLSKRLFTRLRWIGGNYNAIYDRVLWGTMKYLENSVR